MNHNPIAAEPSRAARRVVWLPCLWVLAALLPFGAPAYAQDAESTDRIYKHSKVEVERALQSLDAYSTNRLPVLDGFVKANSGTLGRFENPHYQLRIDLESQGPVQTLVSVTAKITAWAAATETSPSQYVVIPSNGRLEQDMLDRLSVFLERGNGTAPAGSADGSSGSSRPAPGAPSKTNPGIASPVPRPGNSPPPSALTSNSSTIASTSDPDALASEISAVQAQRQQTETNQRRLQQQISELEANASSQKYLANLAVVKATQTPVFQSDDDTSRVLFRADPEDEFEVIAVKENWFHVRLENGAEGWLRGVQLQPPQQVDDVEDAASAMNFTTPNEEIKTFGGDWTQLKGKPALFVFARPSRAIPDSILGQSQLQFAKHVFTEGYRQATHSEQSMAGVVVVFLGDKGGIASATLADIRRWREGAISDKAFFDRCSLDPPESFRDASSAVAVGKN